MTQYAIPNENDAECCSDSDYAVGQDTVQRDAKSVLRQYVQGLCNRRLDVPPRSSYPLRRWIQRSAGNNALQSELEVCALCGDADPRRVCRELHFV